MYEVGEDAEVIGALSSRPSGVEATVRAEAVPGVGLSDAPLDGLALGLVDGLAVEPPLGLPVEPPLAVYADATDDVNKTDCEHIKY